MSIQNQSNKNPFFLKSNSGMSLIELLVAIGILSILTFSIISLISTLFNQTKGFEEKLGKLETETRILSALADGAICSAELANPAINPSAPYHIDATNAATLAASTIALNQIHSGTTPNAPILIQNNTSPSTMANTLKVQSIVYSNFASTGIADQYVATLMVKFDGNLKIQLRPFKMQQIVSTDPASPIGAKVITGCVGAGGGPPPSSPGEVPTGYGIMPKWDGNWTGNHFTCPPGYTLTAQHYDCHCSNNATWFVCIKN